MTRGTIAEAGAVVPSACGGDFAGYCVASVTSLADRVLGQSSVDSARLGWAISSVYLRSAELTARSPAPGQVPAIWDEIHARRFAATRDTLQGGSTHRATPFRGIIIEVSCTGSA